MQYVELSWYPRYLDLDRQTKCIKVRNYYEFHLPRPSYLLFACKKNKKKQTEVKMVGLFKRLQMYKTSKRKRELKTSSF